MPTLERASRAQAGKSRSGKSLRKKSSTKAGNLGEHGNIAGVPRRRKMQLWLYFGFGVKNPKNKDYHAIPVF